MIPWIEQHAVSVYLLLAFMLVTLSLAGFLLFTSRRQFVVSPAFAAFPTLMGGVGLEGAAFLLRAIQERVPSLHSVTFVVGTAGCVLILLALFRRFTLPNTHTTG